MGSTPARDRGPEADRLLKRTWPSDPHFGVPDGWRDALETPTTRKMYSTLVNEATKFKIPIPHIWDEGPAYLTHACEENRGKFNTGSIAIARKAMRKVAGAHSPRKQPRRSSPASEDLDDGYTLSDLEFDDSVTTSARQDHSRFRSKYSPSLRHEQPEPLYTPSATRSSTRNGLHFLYDAAATLEARPHPPPAKSSPPLDDSLFPIDPALSRVPPSILAVSVQTLAIPDISFAEQQDSQASPSKGMKRKNTEEEQDLITTKRQHMMEPNRSQPTQTSLDRAIESLGPAQKLNDCAITDALRYLENDDLQVLDPSWALENPPALRSLPHKLKSTLVIPVCLNIHWFAITATAEAEVVCCYDSMAHSNAKEDVVRRCMKNITDKTTFQLREMWTIDYRVPQPQTNGHDCGVFSILNVMHHLLLSLDSELPPVNGELWRSVVHALLSPTADSLSTLSTRLKASFTDTTSSQLYLRLDLLHAVEILRSLALRLTTSLSQARALLETSRTDLDYETGMVDLYEKRLATLQTQGREDKIGELQDILNNSRITKQQSESKVESLTESLNALVRRQDILAGVLKVVQQCCDSYHRSLSEKLDREIEVGEVGLESRAAYIKELEEIKEKEVMKVAALRARRDRVKTALEGGRSIVET